MKSVRGPDLISSHLPPLGFPPRLYPHHPLWLTLFSSSFVISQQTSPPSTTTGLATPSPSPLRYQVPLPLTHKINTANAHRGRRDYFPSAAPSGMPGLPEEHEGESGDEVLGEEEDEVSDPHLVAHRQASD